MRGKVDRDGSWEEIWLDVITVVFPNFRKCDFARRDYGDRKNTLEHESFFSRIFSLYWIGIWGVENHSVRSRWGTNISLKSKKSINAQKDPLSFWKLKNSFIASRYPSLDNSSKQERSIGSLDYFWRRDSSLKDPTRDLQFCQISFRRPSLVLRYPQRPASVYSWGSETIHTNTNFLKLQRILNSSAVPK